MTSGKLHSQSENEILDGYIKAFAGAGQRLELPLSEAAILSDFAIRIQNFHVELLRALQSSLPRSDDEKVQEIKETLTGLIIMHSRLADRAGSLKEALTQLVESDSFQDVALESKTLRDMAEAIVDSCVRIRDAYNGGVE